VLTLALGRLAQGPLQCHKHGVIFSDINIGSPSGVARTGESDCLLLPIWPVKSFKLEVEIEYNHIIIKSFDWR
jgi:hypothetical protein